jgi:diguanylate cyclase (GGDEF)-like protein
VLVELEDLMPGHTRSIKRAGRLTSVPDPSIQIDDRDDPRVLDTTLADASRPEVLDEQATNRDTAADARDAKAVERDSRDTGISDAARLSVDLNFAARDRAAAALDRQEAALDRQRAQQYLKRAYRDRLTGALQRDAGRDQLHREVYRAGRTEEPLVVAFIDIVGLKRLNDKQGHDVGDRALRAVGRALRAGLRTYDLVVRWGGDEFVCALPSGTCSEAAQRFDEITASLQHHNPPVEITVGITELAPDDTLQDVVNRADKILYAQRRQTAGRQAAPRSLR